MKLKNIPGVIADAVLIFCCAVAAVCFVPTAYEAEFTLRTLLIAEAPIALVISYLFHRVNKLWFIPAIWFSYPVRRFVTSLLQSCVEIASSLPESAASRKPLFVLLLIAF